jgi:hypothetical protein
VIIIPFHTVPYRYSPEELLERRDHPLLRVGDHHVALAEHLPTDERRESSSRQNAEGI